MKKVIQLEATEVTASQKIASAVKDFSGNIFEASPKFIENPTLKFFDRMKGRWNQSTSTAQVGIANFSVNKQGSSYIATCITGASQNFKLDELNPNQFTFIAVVKAKSDGILTSLLLNDLAYTPTEQDIVPRLQITATGNLSVYTGTSTTRLTVPITNPLDLHIYTLTFSINEGLKLYIDGALAGSNSTDLRPLTYNVARFVTSLNSGFGTVISVNDDLSKTQHSAKLKLIHDTLKNQYLPE